MKKAIVAPLFANALIGAGMIACLAMPATAQEATKSQDTHLKAAMAVVEQTGVLPEFENQLQLIVKNSKNWLIRQNPNAEKEISATIEAIAERYKSDRETMVATTSVAWARYLKEDELKEVLAFFQTDTGQKFATYQPRILGEMIADIQNYSRETTQKIVAEAIKELNAKGHKFK